MRMRTVFVSLTCVLLLNACELLGDSAETPEPLDVAAMQVHYRKHGGWINTSTLFIPATGLAHAESIGHGSGQVIAEGTVDLADQERERLAALLAWFPRYRRHYEPKTYYTDGNTHILILHYRSDVDTVSVYNPWDAKMPPSLSETIEELERLYQRAFPEDT